MSVSRRPLFPASVSTGALESLASLAFDAPSHRPLSVAEEQAEAHEDARYERAQDKAADGFDHVDIRCADWLDEQSVECAELAAYAIRGTDEARYLASQAIAALRERYIEERAEAYLPDVDDEIERDREDAEYDDWRWRHG